MGWGLAPSPPGAPRRAPRGPVFPRDWLAGRHKTSPSGAGSRQERVPGAHVGARGDGCVCRYHEAPASYQRRMAARHGSSACCGRDCRGKQHARGSLCWPGLSGRSPAIPGPHTRARVLRCPRPGPRAGQALHIVASSSKVGSGMACQVGSRNSSRLPLGSKIQFPPGKTPSFR